MLTARDQENLVHGHQAMAASKPLNQASQRLAPPKTPGNRYPKTPIRLPLNDENAPTGGGKKLVLGAKGKGVENVPVTGKKAQLNKNAFITPMGPRQSRAPLGMKTTNAKARAFQTPGGFDTEHKPLQQQNSARPQRQRTKQAETVKLEVHADSPLSNEDREPEYCPPRWIEPPYVNDDIDVESLDYSIVHRAAQSDAFRMRYGGATARGKVKEMEEQAKKRQEKEDEEFMKRMAEEDVFIEDVPETHPKKIVEELPHRTRAPLHQRSASAFARKPATSRTANPTQPASTISSRRAASALGGIDSTSRTTSSRPLSTSSHTRSTSTGAALTKKPSPFGLGASRKPALSTSRPASAVPSAMRATSALANSRSTIGYTKGRTASTALNSAFDLPLIASRDRVTRPDSRGGMSSSGVIRPRMGLSRSATTVSMGSGGSTLTPAKWARQTQAGQNDIGIPKSFLEAFEGTQEEEDKDDLGVAHIRLGGEVELPDCLKPQPGEEEEEFVMTLNF